MRNPVARGLLAVSVLLSTAAAPAVPAGRGRPNRLLGEKSPYLQQHAYNPVHWYPWGEEAFAKARRENKPIFLSIGYSTCHWCHVMEKESFSKTEIAAVMNRHFVSIKVDREERPDVDEVYMTAANGAGWGGGWPLSMWLTPELKPFFGGTYFPPDAGFGRPGFKHILERIAEIWKTRQADVRSDAERVTKVLEQYTRVEGRSGPLNPEALDNGFTGYKDSFVASKGGFGGAPKFPMPVNQNFLLRYSARTSEKKALEMTAQTLREMAKGGIYDHMGGGFHRYSTDDKWHIPHFEKMLYDNAQLAVNYLEAYQAAKDPELARVARETLDYVLRDMTHPEGGFYSAEDADSLPPELKGKVEDIGHEHRSEGAFYLWTKAEILLVLGRETGELFSYRYGVEAGGNAESDPQGEFKGKNILYLAHTLPETARKSGKPEAEVTRSLADARRKLLEARAPRPRPHRDDKILSDWNGLMISAFAKAAQVLDDPKYLEAAGRSARFIRKQLYDGKTNRLHRRWREGERKVPGLGSDYALLTQGLIDLYEASFDPAWIEWAVRLSEAQLKLFYDPGKGGFYQTAPGHDKNLLVRTMDDSDNVIPAASSVAALNFLRLSQFTGRKDFREAAEKTLTRFGAQMAQQPRSLPQMLVALDYALSKPRQIIIAGAPAGPDTLKMLREVHQRFIPSKILMVVEDGKSKDYFLKRLPFLKGVSRIKGRATAYVCVNYACELPTNDLEVFRSILDRKPPKGG
ncbi:MAG: thioredoxin domain-containing protein [Elusimicrobia bacterium]|nr:thioredoxin domain-containing protein [Elusimicrobiota bacterium]